MNKKDKDINKDKVIKKDNDLNIENLKNETPIEEVEENIIEDLGVEEEVEQEKPLHELRKDARDKVIRDGGLDPTHGI